MGAGARNGLFCCQQNRAEFSHKLYPQNPPLIFGPSAFYVINLKQTYHFKRLGIKWKRNGGCRRRTTQQFTLRNGIKKRKSQKLLYKLLTVWQNISSVTNHSHTI